MKKKIAVYFSGRCDGYEHCIDKLQEKFYSKYDIDFFWSIDEEEETPYYAELRNLLKPVNVNYKCVDVKVINVPLASSETRQRNTMSMFYHNFYSTQMIIDHSDANNINYHAVVRFRAEIDSDDEFIIEDKLLENTVYIPHGYNYRGVSDRIAYGTLESMSIYGTLYFEIVKYVYARQALFNPEYLVMFHINKNNMSMIRFQYNYKLHHLRHKIKSDVVEKQS
jgi:hypothetical protein